MLIDWFTIGAQALNFVILVWLMKRFLYKPILQAIDAREELIAAQLADADRQGAEARRERAEFEAKNEAFDQDRAALLRQATDEAKAEGQRLQREALEAADLASSRRQETLRSEADDLRQAIGRRTRDEVFAIARQALTELASASLEERICEAFNGRLRRMDSRSKAQICTALKASTGPALVRSAFDLPSAQRAAIQSALNETFSTEIPLRFETAPELIGGIELSTNGQKVAWSVDDYLVSLHKSVDELLGEPVTSPREGQFGASSVPEGEVHEHSA